MEENGEEVATISFNRTTGQPNRFGTENGLAFLRKRTDFISSFLAFVGGMLLMHV